MGAAGEEIVSRWLTDKGLRVVGRNVATGEGEIDLIAWDGPSRVAIEVRTVSGPGDPIEAIDRRKRRRVQRLAAAVGATRVDFVGVAVRPDALVVHWVPG